jgi:RNA polymerase sigma-70 factor, ECF subfamily
MRITEGADSRSQAERQFAPQQHADYVNLLARFWLSQAAPQDFDPSDIVQDVLLAAHARHEQFRGQTEAQYKAWLRQITRNQVIDALKKRRLPQQAIWQVQDASRWTEQWLADGATSVVGRAARDELLSILAETLGRLTEPSREAIILHYLQQLPLQEIAGRMGRSVPSVAGLLRRGLAALRDDPRFEALLRGDPPRSL